MFWCCECCLRYCLQWFNRYREPEYVELDPLEASQSTTPQIIGASVSQEYTEATDGDVSISGVELSARDLRFGISSPPDPILENHVPIQPVTSPGEISKRIVAALRGDKHESQRLAGNQLLHGCLVKLIFDQIDLPQLRAICLAVRANEKITGLELGCNGIGDSGAAVLTECLHSCKHLEHLSIWGNHITDQGLQSLADLIGSCPLERLVLSNNEIADGGLVAISFAIADCSTLQLLDLSVNAATSDRGVSQLIQALKNSRHSSLSTLNLSSGGLSDSTCQCLGSWLSQSSCPLVSLDLSFNLVEDGGAEVLAAALQLNDRLKELNLNGNQLSQKGLKVLLTASNVSGCSISTEESLSVQQY